MRMLFYFALFAVFSIPFAYAPGEGDSFPPPVPDTSGTYLFKAVFSNGSDVAKSPIIAYVHSGGDVRTVRGFTDASGGFFLELGNGNFGIDALLDYYETPGMDFAASSDLAIPSDGGFSLIFYPCGSMSGKVFLDGMPADKAEVIASCTSPVFDYSRINGQVLAKSGSFVFQALPVGRCAFSSTVGSYAGSIEAEVLHGKTAKVEIGIQMKAPVQGEPAKRDDPMPYYAAFFLFCAALAALLLFFAAKGKRHIPAKPIFKEELQPGTSEKPGAALQKEAVKKPKSAPAISPKGKFNADGEKIMAVLATLSERETEILRFLFDCGGKAKRSKIQRELLIPKTSLVRNLRSLERKNIIMIERMGRSMVAQVSDWLVDGAV